MRTTLDKSRVARAFARNQATYDTEATVQHQMALDLVSALTPHCPAALRGVLEVGCGTGLVTHQLLASHTLEDYTVNDLVPAHTDAVVSFLRSRGVEGVDPLPGDVEGALQLPGSRSLVVSGATLQWMASVETVLARMLHSLAPGGILAFTTFGPENCREIRTLTQVGLRYVPLSSLRSVVSGQADILESRESTATLHFPDAYEVLRHLKRTGVNGVGRGRWTPQALREFSESYARRFQGANGFPLTYHPLLVVARKR